MKALTNTLFSKSLLTVVAWLSILVSVGAALYALYGGVETQLASYIMIGAAVFFIVGFFGAVAGSAAKLSKEDKMISGIFDKWHTTFGIPDVTSKNKKSQIAKYLTYSLNSKGQLEDIKIQGNETTLTPETVIKFTEHVKKLQKRSKKEPDFEYVVKLDELALDGSVYVKRVPVESKDYRVFFAKLQSASILTEVIGDIYGSIPEVSFSEGFETGNSDSFSRVVFEGEWEKLNEEDVNTITANLTEAFPLEDGVEWGFDVVSDSVFSFVKTGAEMEEYDDHGVEDELQDETEEDESPQYDFVEDGTYLLKSFEAASRKAEIEGLVEVNNIDLVEADGDQPMVFDVGLDIDKTVDRDKIILAAKFVIILLNNKYEAVWKVADQLEERETLTFKRFE